VELPAYLGSMVPEPPAAAVPEGVTTPASVVNETPAAPKSGGTKK
jgi:hypothetical protein